MSNARQNNQPNNDWSDNIIHFFFGSIKRVGRTFLAIGIIVALINIDAIIAWSVTVLNKLAVFTGAVMNAWLPVLIVFYVIYLLLFRKPRKK
jgi:hypothetical protein